MKGELRGDFTRDTFHKKKHFARVLMQQGRVQLDADWNEQTDILLHYIQTLAKDIMGPFAGPDGLEFGFEIKPNGKDNGFGIGYGRYYVDGILIENEKDVSPCKTIVAGPMDYYEQPDYPIKIINKDDISLQDNDLPLLVYLDVWERHISCFEDDDIREKALVGPDTATRSKVVWQVKVLKSGVCNWKNFFDKSSCSAIKNNWTSKNGNKGIIETCLQNPNRGCLKARARKSKENNSDPCIISPESSYLGAENQLYRVEIHRGGKAKPSGSPVASDNFATFKWSRDNATIVFPISSISGNEFTLEHLGRDERSSLNVGEWVEVIDDDYTLLILSRPSPSKPRHLAQVDTVSLTDMKVTLKLKDELPNYADLKHPLLRRWDYKVKCLGKPNEPTPSNEPTPAEECFSGLLVEEGNCADDKEDGWYILEDGVQICFQKPSSDDPDNQYQTGDYWLIPARTATGDVEWPIVEGKRAALPPHGVDHHYAPLAVIYSDQIPTNNPTNGGQADWKSTNCRCKIIPPTDCAKD